MQRFLSALAISALSTVATAQLSVVIPNGTANAPGNSSNAFPWGTSAATWPGLRLMCVYGSVNFTAQNVSAPILINQLKWRPNDTTGAVTGGTFATATVELSTSPTGFGGITTNYATNHGADRTVVYSGSVVHTPTPGSAGWTPQSWCVDIMLTTPFLYDPAAGDLVIDVDYPTGSFSGGSVGQMDVEGANSNAARIFASSMYPVANGMTQNHGVVVEVGYVPPAGFAYASGYGTGCTQRASASFYELFANGSFDLSNSTLLFTPTPDGYVVLVLAGAPQWFTPTSTALSLGDDVVTPANPLGFTLPFAGSTTTDVFISSNGFVYGAPSTSNGCCNGSPPILLSGGPRWSPLWNDLNPAAGGSVFYDVDPANSAAYVTFDQVPEFGTTNTNTFQVAFNSSGIVEFRFQSCSVTNHQVVTGWSPGQNNQDPGPTDISSVPVLITMPDLVSITHNASARPVIGTNFTLDTANVPAAATIGANIYGLTEINPGIDLTSIGMPGCSQYVSADANVVWVPTSGTGSAPFSVPNDPGLAGIEIKSQSACLVSGVNTLGALSSNGVKLVIDVN